jgi:hypothetical protein
MLFERLAADLLLAASRKAAGKHLGLSWDEIHEIMDRAVERKESSLDEFWPTLTENQKESPEAVAMEM